MKIRYSLVSNSSSSNFIVWYKDSLFNKPDKILLTKDQIKLLKKNHFQLSTCTHPSNLDESDFLYKGEVRNKSRRKYTSLSYALSISCNQDDIISFLVKNNISFIASIHYGHETCVYHKNSKYIYFFTNFGDEVETYHQDDNLDEVINKWKKQEALPSRKILVTSYIREQKETSEELRTFWSKGMEYPIKKK